VRSASPSVSANGVTMVNGSESYEPSTFTGTVPSYLTARNYSVAEGAGITKADVKQHKRVLVLGPTVVQSLFGGADPVGASVRVNGTQFQVVGVTAPKGSNGTTDQDDVVFAPLTTVQDTLTGYAGYSTIVVQGRSAAALDAAQTEVSTILDQRKDVTDPTNPGFQVINQGSVRQASTASTDVFTTLLGAVAAISLLVGGIGVMNIMLVSVTERTREIGIRKAIGARRADILGQFLTEAVLVSILGGITGVLVGLVGSHFRIAGVQPSVALYSVPLAFGASVLAGLFFGTYPAGRAARMRPIDALRFE
jgi:putative ABC transport system permease protein